MYACARARNYRNAYDIRAGELAEWFRCNLYIDTAWKVQR